MCFGMGTGRVTVPLRGCGGGSGPDGVRSEHSWGAGRATRRATRRCQAGRPGHIVQFVAGLRLAGARAGKCPEGAASGAQPQTGWPARFMLTWAVGRLTSMLSPNGLNEAKGLRKWPSPPRQNFTIWGYGFTIIVQLDFNANPMQTLFCRPITNTKIDSSDSTYGSWSTLFFKIYCVSTLLVRERLFSNRIDVECNL